MVAMFFLLQPSKTLPALCPVSYQSTFRVSRVRIKTIVWPLLWSSLPLNVTMIINEVLALNVNEFGYYGESWLVYSESLIGLHSVCMVSHGQLVLNEVCWWHPIYERRAEFPGREHLPNRKYAVTVISFITSETIFQCLWIKQLHTIYELEINLPFHDLNHNMMTMLGCVQRGMLYNLYKTWLYE